MIHYDQKFNEIIAWRIITELYRKNHDQFDFDINMIYPGFGDPCLSMWHKDEHFCFFNLYSGNYHNLRGNQNSDLGHGNESLDIPENNYNYAFLKEDKIGIIKKIAQSMNLNFENTTPSSNAKAITLRVMSGLLERFAYFSRKVYH